MIEQEVRVTPFAVREHSRNAFASIILQHWLIPELKGLRGGCEIPENKILQIS